MDSSRRRSVNRPTDGLPSMLRALPLAHRYSSGKGGRAPGAIDTNHGSLERTETRDGSFLHEQKNPDTSLNGKEPHDAHEVATASPSSEKSGAIASLLEWSNIQSHILTGAGRLNDLYRAPRFPFTEDELPHHHLAKKTTCTAFVAWRQEVRRHGFWRASRLRNAWVITIDSNCQSTTAPSPDAFTLRTYSRLYCRSNSAPFRLLG